MDFLDKNPCLSPYSGKIEVGDWTLESVREKIGALTTEARQIAKQPPTAEDVKSRARARLDALGQASLSPDGKVSFPRSRSETIAPDRDSALLAACYAISPDETLAMIDRLAEATYPADGLVEMDRKIKLRDLQDQILGLERIEEELIGQGVRRAGASPLAILGLVHAARRRAAA